MDNMFIQKSILQSILNYDHDTIICILTAHGIKRISLGAGREFGDSATFNGYSQQDNIDLVESDNDFHNLHHLAYEDHNVDDERAVVNNGCNTMMTHQQKMRAAVAEFLSIAEGGISVDSCSKVMDDVLSILRAATVQLRAQNHMNRNHMQSDGLQ
jgi:hypothetical protein